MILLGLWHKPSQASDYLWLFQPREMHCLVKNIYYESRGESVLGQEAVAKVTLNRVKDSRFKNTICKVVYEPKQFSWTIKPPKGKINLKAWKQAEDVAYRVITGQTSLVNFKATHFHTKFVQPGWRDVRKVAKIGNHIFYA